MIRVEAIENFNYKDFKNIKEITRANNETHHDISTIYVGDSFVATEEQYNYLTIGNPTKRKLVRIIEYVPDAQ